MRFSIVIPIYNAEKYLHEAVLSIVNQSYEDYEVILVDDGSTDSSYDICNDLSKKYKNLRLIKKDNGGSTSARKVGADASNGEYILLLDSDDFYNSQYLQECSRIIDAYSPDCICFGYNVVVDGHINSQMKNSVPQGFYTGVDMEKIKQNIIFDVSKKNMNSGNTLYTIWSKAIKRDIYISNQNKIDDKLFFGEDLVLTSFVINNSASIYYSDFLATNYRLRDSSISHKYDSKIFAQLQLLSRILHETFGDNDKRISFYLYQQMQGQLALAAKNYKIRQFKKEIKKNKDIFATIFQETRYLNLEGFSMKERIKHFLYKNKLFNLMYLLYRAK